MYVLYFRSHFITNVFSIFINYFVFRIYAYIWSYGCIHTVRYNSNTFMNHCKLIMILCCDI